VPVPTDPMRSVPVLRVSSLVASLTLRLHRQKGGDKVVAVVQVSGVGPGSQIAMETVTASDSSSRSRMGGRCDNSPSENREEALEAAGLRE
jgi:hypothetical protein